MLLACRLAVGLASRYAVTYWDGRLSCPVPLLPASGGVQVDRARLRLPDHWIDLVRQTQFVTLAGRVRMQTATA
jgi:hypothetical protein